MDDNDLEELYNKYLEFTAQAIDQYKSGAAVAAIMMTQAMGIYRTILSDEEYDAMASEIWERRNEITSLNKDTIQ
jgi:hypothetical protein